MDIQAMKIELAKLILDIENPSLIQKIKDLLIKESSDFWAELSDEEKAEIKLGIEQLNAGKRTSFEDFMKRVS